MATFLAMGSVSTPDLNWEGETQKSKLNKGKICVCVGGKISVEIGLEAAMEARTSSSWLEAQGAVRVSWLSPLKSAGVSVTHCSIHPASKTPTATEKQHQQSTSPNKELSFREPH